LILLIAVFVLILLLQPTSSLTRTLFGKFITVAFEEQGTINTAEPISRLILTEEGLLSTHPGSYFRINTKAIEESTGYSAPINQAMADAAGKYQLFYQQNGRSLKLCRGGEERTSIETEFPLLSASVNSRGDITAITEDSGHKSRVTVYRKDGTAIYRWHSGADLATGAAMHGSVNELAVCTLSLAHTTPYAYLELFNTGATEPIFKLDLGERIPIFVKFAEENLMVVGFTDGISAFRRNGEEVYRIQCNGTLKGWALDEPLAPRLLVTEGGTDTICLYDRGKLEHAIDLASEQQLITSFKNLIAVSSMNRILLLDSKGETLAIHDAKHEVQHLVLLDNKTLIYGIGNELKLLKIK
jgi:hypothetical protein